MKIVKADGVLDGYSNMERDRALLDDSESGKIGARIYGWDGPWVSLGISQNPKRDLLDSSTIQTVQRPTGGKAVLHGHDLTIGLAIPLKLLEANPEKLDKLSRSVVFVYRAVAESLIWALNQSGVSAVLADESRFANLGPKTADCFAHVAPNDIINPMTGVKVCGCALKLTRTAVLVQASIPVGPPLVDPRKIFKSPSTPSHCTFDKTEFSIAFDTWLVQAYNGSGQFQGKAVLAELERTKR